MSNLVIVGDVTVDLLVQVESIPRSGEDAVVRQLSILPGGSAANCAVSAARLGSRVKFIGVTGKDVFDPMLRTDLTLAGVDIQHLRQVDGSTSLVIAMIDTSGERTFLSYRGAAATQEYGDVTDSILQPGDILHVSGYAFQTPHSGHLAQRLMAIARQVKAKISLDPSYIFARELEKEDTKFLQGIDYLFPNEEEALLITGSKDIGQAARRLVDLGVKTVLLKLGEYGCLVAGDRDQFQIPAYEVNPIVDLTGAGDAFAGGFLAAITAGCDLQQAVTVGQATAACVISQIGGHAGAPALAQLNDFSVQVQDQRLMSALESMQSQGWVG